MPNSIQLQSLVQIIVSSSIESRVKKILKNVDIQGYTLFGVRGQGDTGLQSSLLDSDSNTMFMVVLDADHKDALYTELKKLKQNKYHVMVFSSNVEMLN